ncbi:uncharacterized protein LOC124166044 isoform X1 [Ischnura elegans]|uniref:uncharacterized protein LOC124166044 isoform X1 n=1 Tax=Ischnura elegans TaxID=197161 RepID=UPI001ED89A06|nr:uncharacterized protein LOC124166044 isoform X1 [Ischnura elegans]
MSREVCMSSMPGNSPRMQQRMYRISSESTLSYVTSTIPEYFTIDTTILNANRADPPLNFDEIGTISFFFKLAQLFFAVVCAGLQSEGIKIAGNRSTAEQLLPYIVYSVYMIINTVTITSYVLGQKMPQRSMQMFTVIGCILFTASGATCLNVWGSYEAQKDHPPNSHPMLLGEGFISLANAALYAIDTCYSFHKGMIGSG